MVGRVGLSASLVLVTLDLSASFSIASSTPGTRTNKISSTLRMMAEESEAARREKLTQLFGAEAGAKIAENTGSAPRDLPVEQIPNVEEEIQMLVEGMQQLEFGGIRLIDVDMAPDPRERVGLETLDAAVFHFERQEHPDGHDALCGHGGALLC